MGEEHLVDMGEKGTYDKRNKLNELPSKDWIKFTKSWFSHYPPPRKEGELLHPAKFPEKLVKEFIEFFTKSNAVVFDPFLGTGSTLVACDMSNRQGVGIELQKKYADIARKRTKQKVITGNSLDLEKFSLPKIDLVITSPPYGPMLNKNVGEVQKLRKKDGLDTSYSDDKNDLGNIKDYDDFVEKISEVFIKTKKFLNKGAYIIIVLQNYRDGGEYRTLAWDLGSKLKEHFTLKGEKIWCQDHKTLYPYSYRWDYVPNVHHHYCLIFKHDKSE